MIQIKMTSVELFFQKLYSSLATDQILLICKLQLLLALEKGRIYQICICIEMAFILKTCQFFHQQLSFGPQFHIQGCPESLENRPPTQGCPKDSLKNIKANFSRRNQTENLIIEKCSLLVVNAFKCQQNFRLTFSARG